MRAARLIGGFVVGLGLPATCIAQTPSLTLINPGPGRIDSFGRAISADGQTVTGYTLDSNSVTRGYSWTRQGGLNEWGALPNVPLNANPVALSASGTDAVGSRSFGSGQSEAFRFRGGTYQTLGATPSGFDGSVANGVSGDGSVIAGAFYTSATGSSVGMRWTAATGMVNVGKPRPNDFAAGFFNISRDGSTAVGLSKRGFDDADPYTWTQAGGWRQLPVPTGTPALHDAEARAVNFDGSLVVGSVRDFSVGTSAVLWRNGAVESLGAFGSNWSMEAWGVSDTGSVVVGNGLNMTTSRYNATIWLNGGAPVLLQDYLASIGVTLPAGWRLEVCGGISADGRFIVGDAINGARHQAFIAEIPAPGGVLIGVGALAVFGPRRRRPACS